MTDYQQRIQELRERLTPDAQYADLVRLHDHLLFIAPHIRIGSRWGDYTTYTTRLREPDAVILTDGKLRTLSGGQGRYRIEMGADARGLIHARLEYWEPQPLYQWDAWDDPEVSARLWDWLRVMQPAAEVLLAIDVRLLQYKEVAHD